jgi:ribosomal protein L7/L12
MAYNKEELLETIGNMTVLELSEFVDAFKEKFNVTAVAAAPMAVAGGAAEMPPSPRRRTSSTSSSRRPATRRSRSSRWSARSPPWG